MQRNNERGYVKNGNIYIYEKSRKNKIRYKTGSDGKVTVNVNGKPVGIFADKATAREFTAAAKAAVKTTRDTNKATMGKLATKGGCGYTLTTNAELLKAAKGTDKKFSDLKREAVKGGHELYRQTRKAGEEQLNTALASMLAKYGTAYTAPTTTTTGQQQSTSRTMRTQKPTVNSATNKVANAIQSTSKAINKRAGVGKYQSKLRSK